MRRWWRRKAGDAVRKPGGGALRMAALAAARPAADYWDWASVTGVESAVFWLDPLQPVPPGHETWALDAPPRLGGLHTVRLSPSFRLPADGRFWALYLPALAALNGWLEYPELLAESIFVECRCAMPLRAQPRGQTMLVEALELLPLPALRGYFPPTTAGAAYAPWFLERPEELSRATCGPLTFIDRNVQGNWGDWLVCHSDGDRHAVVLGAEWSPGEDRVFAGHRRLSPAEARALGLTARADEDI